MSKRLYLVRHAEPLIRNGRKGQLSRTGIRQVNETVTRLSREVDDRITILHSPSLRCKQTAQIIADALGVSIKEEVLRVIGSDKLTLSDSGKLDGYLEVQAKLGIESPKQFRERIDRLVQNIPGDVILVGNELPIALLMKYDTKGVNRNIIMHASCRVSVLTENGDSIWKQLV